MPRLIGSTGAAMVNAKVPPFDLAYDYCAHQWGTVDAFMWRTCMRGCGGVKPPVWLHYPPEMLANDVAVLEIILDRIRQGASPRDACLSLGFSASQWQAAMSSHTPAGQDFRRLLAQAQAQARVDAAVTLKATKVEMWALKGPGRKSASIDGEADTFGDEEKKVAVTASLSPIPVDRIPPDKLAAFAEEALAYLEGDEGETDD